MVSPDRDGCSPGNIPFGVVSRGDVDYAGRKLTEFIYNTSNEIIQITGPANLLLDQGGNSNQNNPVGVGNGPSEANQGELGITIDTGPGGRIELGADGTIDLSKNLRLISRKTQKFRGAKYLIAFT